jgi:peptidase E
MTQPQAELLLLSNSTVQGMGFLGHATGAIRAVLGDRSSLLFVPFASNDPATPATASLAASARGSGRCSS